MPRSPRHPANTDRRASSTALVTIDSLAAGGDGVARADGLVVFVPRTAPGDVAEVDFEPGPRFARGRLRALQTASPQRVAPECPHYTRDRCGGCQLQHLSYVAQLAAKSRFVRDAMRRIGRRDVPTPDVHPSRDAWRYRRKLTLALRRREGAWIAGLHPYDAPGEIFALDDCLVTEERVVGVWREIMAAADGLPESSELRGAVRVDETGVSLALEGGRDWPASGDFFERLPALTALWWTPERGARTRLHERGAPGAPGAAFTQVNPRVAGELHWHVLTRALSYAPETLVDAYAGVGDLASAVAERGVTVTAIELDQDAAAWSAARLPAGSRAVAARVEDALGLALPADVVVLNPPRGGVDARVTDTLERAVPGVRAILYVSCDPATLARDVARLPRWRIASLVCFDMFPQTAHVETVCELVPADA